MLRDHAMFREQALPGRHSPRFLVSSGSARLDSAGVGGHGRSELIEGARRVQA
jgi:hypothetical protein